jgi:hypothetical protein
MSVAATALASAQTTELETRTRTWPERARAAAVTDADSFRQAGELLTGIKALRSEIASTCDPVIAAAHKAHKAATGQKQTLEGPLVEAETIIKQNMATWSRAEDQRRRDEEARLTALARQQEEESRLAEAVGLEAAGEPELAAAVLDAPSTTAAVTLPKAAADGVSMRQLWRGECLDLRKLCAAIADGTVPPNAVVADQKVLNNMARALKENFNWPGCKAVVETSVAAQARY